MQEAYNNFKNLNFKTFRSTNQGIPRHKTFQPILNIQPDSFNNKKQDLKNHHPQDGIIVYNSPTTIEIFFTVFFSFSIINSIV
jgi:hypothetical protein